MDEIARNAGHPLPRRADEVSECLWTIPCADWKAGRDLLVGIGFVYNPDLNNINAGGEFPLEGLEADQVSNPPKTAWVAEMKLPEYGSPEVTFEDGGQAAYVEIGEGDAQITGSDRCFFVRLQSWDDLGAVARGQPRPAPGSHKKFMSLLGKKVRVTIEVIDE